MRNLIISSALILITGTTIAQQVPFSSQYYANPFVTNPAFTGNHERTNAFLTHRSQWTGISGAPQTSYLTLDGPIEAKNIGLGLNLYSDVNIFPSNVVVTLPSSVNSKKRIVFFPILFSPYSILLLSFLSRQKVHMVLLQKYSR